MDTQTELLSIVLTLESSPQPGSEVPAWWGRAAHAFVLDLIRQSDERLAVEIHDGDGLKPFTVSTLIPVKPGPAEGGALYRLRITGLTAAVCTILKTALRTGGALAPGKEIELDYRTFTIREPGDQLPAAEWLGSGRYDALAASKLSSAAQPPRRFGLVFTSPTAFHQAEKTMPLPLPGLVFGSLLERWNSFAPIQFPPEARRYAEECLGISSFDLNSRPAWVKNGGLRLGAVGEVGYTALTYDRYWQSVLDVLAGLALFSGVGVMTAQGFGQCRRLPDI
ncbi:MAG: CRISPR system precrRNA processing endoribonuclease RAMP protein Cas6 [Leptolinea sp.]|jgi:CRISPR-associated endoribonuclease Cas6|nr:CRISPR system precrRNA processing endoribonuclease RAMP protein Cas6 [Leptolinea sp.]